MKKSLALLVSLFLLTLAGSAFAQRQSGAGGNGNSYRAAVQRNMAQHGQSTDVRVRYVRDSASGRSAQVLVQTNQSGTVRAMNVRGGTAYRTQTGLVSQSTARGTANSQMRRERGAAAGTFSGVNNGGLSTTGRTYRFTSATDRRGSNAERTFVSPTTGQSWHTDRP